MSQYLNFDPSHALAGGTGGLLRFMLNPTRPLWQAIVSGFLGVGLAIYFTPIAYPFADMYLERLLGKEDLAESQVAAAVGCLIGMTAPNIIERFIEFVRTNNGPKPPAR